MINIISAAMLLSVLVEGIIEHFVKGAISERFKAYTPYIAAGLSIILCFVYNVDFFASAGLFSEVPALGKIVGSVFTGLIIARGSNYTHDFFSKFSAKKDEVAKVSSSVQG